MLSTCSFNCTHKQSCPLFAAPSIKTEPADEYEADHMGFAMPQILGLLPHSYYHSPQRSVQHPDNGLVPSMASCQRLSSSLPSHDSRFQQQSPTIVYPRGGKSLSGSPGLYQQQTGGMMPDPHRSVLVHTGSPSQSVGPIGAGQHPSIIQFSPTNHHMLRAGDPQSLSAAQPDPQQIIYCDGFSPQAASAHSPTPPLAQAVVTHPEHYPTVIQQQSYVQKGQQKSRASPGGGQMEAPGERRVMVKEENLDQAYLDDGECKLWLLYSTRVVALVTAVCPSRCEEKQEDREVMYICNNPLKKEMDDSTFGLFLRTIPGYLHYPHHLLCTYPGRSFKPCEQSQTHKLLLLKQSSPADRVWFH